MYCQEFEMCLSPRFFCFQIKTNILSWQCSSCLTQSLLFPFWNNKDWVTFQIIGGTFNCSYYLCIYLTTSAGMAERIILKWGFINVVFWKSEIIRDFPYSGLWFLVRLEPQSLTGSILLEHLSLIISEYMIVLKCMPVEAIFNDSFLQKFRSLILHHHFLVLMGTLAYVFVCWLLQT